MLIVRMLFVAITGKRSQVLSLRALKPELFSQLFRKLPAIGFVEQRLFGKGKGKQAEIQYSCGFAAGWLPKS